MSTQAAEVTDGEWTYDPNEPRYCLCNQVSYGDMVACDNVDVSHKQTCVMFLTISHFSAHPSGFIIRALVLQLHLKGSGIVHSALHPCADVEEERIRHFSIKSSSLFWIA